MTKFITKRLRLKVNEAKSSVGRPWKRKYLGFSLTSSRAAPKVKPYWKSVEKLKDRIREVTKRTSQVKWVMIALPKSYFESQGLVIPWT